MARMLLVEDDRSLVRALVRGLTAEGHAIDTAHDGTEGLELATGGEHELLILDVMLPGRTGLDICRQLRQTGRDVPILMLTARDDTPDVVAGLDAGANDYLTKPFAFEELLARIRALLRVGTAVTSSAITAGDLRVDLAARSVIREGSPVELTNMEYRLLDRLLRHRGSVVTRDQLAQALWAHHEEPGSDVIPVYVAALRRKLDPADGPSWIHTVRGVGYRFRADSSSSSEVGAS